MGNENGHTSFDDMIDMLVAQPRSVSERWIEQEPLDGIVIETPSRINQEKKWFFRLPWRLFTVLAPFPGKALAIYMMLWRESMMQSSSSVALTTTSLRLCGLTRREKTQALAHLEKEGLITVTRQRGKNPQVTVLALMDRFGRKPTG